MKIIEAMKRLKANTEKIEGLQKKIGLYCANLSHETPLYGSNTSEQIKGWVQACTDLTQENMNLHLAIQKTNLATEVTIEISGKAITKSIAAWVLRRRLYAAVDRATWMQLTDRGLKEGTITSSQGEKQEVRIQRYYNPVQRDAHVEMYRSEPHLIDGALEIINATTDLIV